jgi:hypothetical protein
MPKPPGSIATFTRMMLAYGSGRRSDMRTPCAGCSACCRDPAVEIDLRVGEEAQYPEAIPSAGGGWQLPRKPNGECVHLLDGHCSIYDRRPQSCHGFDCRLLLLGVPINVNWSNFYERVQEMWGEWRLETPEDVDAMFAWHRALMEMLQSAAASGERDMVAMINTLMTLVQKYLPTAHEARDALGMQEARARLQEQDRHIRAMLHRNAEHGKAMLQAAE